MNKHSQDNPGRLVPRRARHDLAELQEKRAQVVELRSRGLTWDQVAAQTGYSNASAASKAWHAAIRQRPDLTVDQVRAAERERLEHMDSELARIVTSPPIKSTAIGKVMYDPRTCTCGAGNTPDHEPGCDVKPVLDESVVIAALRERRLVGESYRRLTGADQAPAGTNLTEEFITKLAQARAAQEYLARQAPAVPLAPLPGNYGDLPPGQQADVQIARLRDQVTAQRAAITATVRPQPGDDTITDAEIIG